MNALIVASFLLASAPSPSLPGVPEPTNLPSGLPPAFSITIIILTTAVSLGPTLLRMFAQFSGQSRVFNREKERLELLKLRYEIEAFKQEKSLPDLTEPPIRVNDPAQTLLDAATHVSSPSIVTRFLIGTTGAAIPGLLVALVEALRHNSAAIAGWGYWMNVLILSLIGGGLVLLIPRRQANRQISFLVGLSFTLFLQLTIQRMSEVPPDVLIQGKIVAEDGTSIGPETTIATLPPGRVATATYDGMFQIVLPPGRRAFLRVDSPGFLEQVVTIDVGKHQSQNLPTMIRLTKKPPYMPPSPTPIGPPPVPR